MSSEKPMIACLPNGPYYLINDSQPRTLANLRKADGTPCATVAGVALCRCGGSANKPFCDGTHGRIGFSDQRLNDGSTDRRDVYVGRRITIHDNRSVCAHAGVCTDGLKSVFRMGQEPWIDPDGADVEAIAALIDRCPSGALSYTLDGAAGRAPEREPMVTVIRNGPYAITGGIGLLHQFQGEGASSEHYALCRCGASKNKPYCDGSHWEVGFEDGD